MPPVDIEHQVNEGDTITVGSIELEVWHTPGHTNSQLAFRVGDVLLSGKDYIRETFAETYAGLQRQDQTVIAKHVRVLSPEVAIVIAVSEGTYTDQAGWTSDPVGIGHTIVLVREDGQWRARHVHQSVAR